MGATIFAPGPPWTDDGVSAYFLAVNRNKRSVGLDLKAEAGREIFRRLVRGADVVVENYRAGTLDGLGLGWDALRAENPRLVQVSLTAYGSSGPYRDLPGYDIVVQAMGGLMSITGEPDGRPMRVGVAIVDVLGAPTSRSRSLLRFESASGREPVSGSNSRCSTSSWRRS